MVPEAHRPLGRLAEPPVRPGRLEVSGPFVLLWTTSSALVAHKDTMATSPCEGRAVALFDADAAAPCETSLAGIPLSARARVQTKCIEGDLAEVELMREDALASSRREGQPFETVARTGDVARELPDVFADVNLISHLLSLSARRVWVVEDL